MVSIFTIEDHSQQSNCKTCPGATKEYLKLIQCSHATCGHFFHVACIDEKLAASKLEHQPYWYCSLQCKDAHMPDRIILEAKKDPHFADAIKLLEERLSELNKQNQSLADEIDQMIHAAQVMDSTIIEMEEHKKKTQADLCHFMLSSSLASRAFQSAAHSSFFPSFQQPSQANVKHTVNESSARILERSKFLEPAQNQLESRSQTVDNPFSVPASKFSPEDMTRAHVQSTSRETHSHSHSHKAKVLVLESQSKQRSRSTSSSHSSSSSSSSNSNNSKASRNSSSCSISNVAQPDRHQFIGETPACDFDDCGNVIYKCENFANRKFDTKLAHRRLKGYCSRCLRKGHLANDCPNTELLPPCKVENCNDSYSHTSIMHPPECAHLYQGSTSSDPDGEPPDII